MEYGKNCFDTSHAFGLLIHFTTSIPNYDISGWIWLCTIQIFSSIYCLAIAEFCRSIFENQKTLTHVSQYDIEIKYNRHSVWLYKSHLHKLNSTFLHPQSARKRVIYCLELSLSTKFCSHTLINWMDIHLIIMVKWVNAMN